jgi:PAS domain S-box-containing protein
MPSDFLEKPKLFRHLAEDLPVGIYMVDREGLIRFWNHGVEHLTGHLSHDVVGHLFEEVVRACDRRGNPLNGVRCPVTMTLNQRKPQRCTAFYLHKNGHYTAVRISTRPIVEYGDAVGGATVMVQEAFVPRDEALGAPLYGCVDATTGVPSTRLTRAVLSECMAGMEETHTGFGLLRVRVLGLEEFTAKHGPQSGVPFRRTAAQTLRCSLDVESFLGCWGGNEFVVVLPSASPMMVAMTAEIVLKLLCQSEVSWWGDRFLVNAEVGYNVATVGSNLECLLQEMKPSHPKETTKVQAVGAAAATRG